MSQAVGQQSPWQLGTIPCSLSGCQKKKQREVTGEVINWHFPFLLPHTDKEGLEVENNRKRPHSLKAIRSSFLIS